MIRCLLSVWINDNKFEETKSFELKSETGRKEIASISYVTTAFQKGTSSGEQLCSAQGIVRSLGMPVSTVYTIVCNILHCYLWKTTLLQDFLSADLKVIYTFVLEYPDGTEEEIKMFIKLMWTVKPISIFKALWMHKIALYEEQQIKSHMSQYRFIL